MIDQPILISTPISVPAQQAASVLFQKIRSGRGKCGPFMRDWTEIEIALRVQQAINDAACSTGANSLTKKNNEK